MARPSAEGRNFFERLAKNSLQGRFQGRRGMATAIRTLASATGLTEVQTRSWLNHARKNHWVEHDQTKRGFRLTLTDKGRQKWHAIQLSERLKPGEWDGRWRIVMFDVPGNHKSQRDALRIKLKQLGLLQLQASNWITPHPCSDQISLISERLHIRPYVRVIEAKRFEGDAKYVAEFGLL